MTLVITDVLTMFASLLMLPPFNIILGFVMASLSIGLIYKILN